MTERAGIPITRPGPGPYEVRCNANVSPERQGNAGAHFPMNCDDFGTSWKSSDILMPGASPKDCRALRKPAAILVAGRDGPKDSLTQREVEDFLLLAPGERVVVLDQETGEFWRGSG